MEFLIGNPFSTPVGQRIEHATSSSLPAEDWSLNMEICDVINDTEEGPKDAVRAIKKRIVGNKNFREVMLALTVLEACVKNCGHRFHLLVSTREFVEGVLVRAILPKNNPPLVLHDRVLGIIQAWADAFRSSPDLTGVVSVYEDLRRKGLEFPMIELDGYSPIHTPHRERRLKSDLEVIHSNLTVMSDMMSQLEPGGAQQSDTELLQQLFSQCKGMQSRLVEVIPRLSEEKMVQEVLAANDDINNVFSRYHRFQRQNSTQQNPASDNLIDLNPTSYPVSQSEAALAHTAVNTLSSQMDDSSDSTLLGSSPQFDWMVEKGMIPINQSAVMDDIEKWLEFDEDDDLIDSEGVTSEEFDRFLAERAKAAERLPSLRASSHDPDQQNQDQLQN
ncbi:target of Myb1 membrane trafficking protein [Chanos chanos]|uniref:Target of Myb1 membrane trafficking protein n=1 Tax=Chanos chanos TaxID=29144 RepID=A0A6J2WZQ0_CHACN|nr:target of Myb protein 1-like [Chanos chanos]